MTAAFKGAIIWDLDGTIASTEQAHFAAWQEILAHEGVDYSYERFLHDFGRNNGELLPELLGPDISAERIDEISRRKEAAFRRYLHQGYGVRLLPGVLDWLKRFDEAGVKQAIGSSGPMANIVALVEKLEIGDYFYGLLTGIRLSRGKPHPAIFLNVAAAIETEPARCIVIEDSLHGVEAALRGGMPVVAVGRIADSPGLADLLERIPKPECFTVADLTQLTWPQIERLWSA